MKHDTMPAVHNIPPVYDGKSVLLILGSFPSVRSREEGFFYMHKRNRFWPVMAHILGLPEPQSIEERKQLLLSHRIALWDVCSSCEIAGSGDASIRNAEANDICSLIEKTQIKAVFVNGRTAANLYHRLIEEKIGLEAVVLPSTSPANASYNMEKLVESWRAVTDVLLKFQNNISNFDK